VGGIESVAALLAHEWTEAGESVTIVTDVAAPPLNAGPLLFPVVHQPGVGKWVRLLRGHDVFVHFNISLRAFWPLLFVRRPFVAVHHGFYIVDRSGRRDWREKLKLWLTRYATNNIAVSHAIAAKIATPSVVIPNPYDTSVFRHHSGGGRRRELIFVGRLVSDKGVATLLDALSVLRKRNLRPNLAVVGDGPERRALEKLAAEHKLSEQVMFTGAKTRWEIADLLREHKLLVVPSLWDEPFGIVALEGIGCGCAVIGSESGGLPEAIGPCGVTFPNGDSATLANRIEELLCDEAQIAELLSGADEHLAKHQPARVAAQYVRVIQTTLCHN
jgi:glycosyltransferase involved in cell wall biosynthesis